MSIFIIAEIGINHNGDISIASSENMQSRFEACGWKVIKIDGHNFSQIRKALKDSNNSTKPVLIDCKTIIAFGSPNKSGSSKSHGSPLGASEIGARKRTERVFPIVTDIEVFFHSNPVGSDSSKELS